MEGPFVFAPSEQVLLGGEQFAQRARFGGVDLLQGEAKVSAAELARTILLAALLANEQHGALRLELRSRKVLLGLASVRALYAEPTLAQVPWPEHSLEARIPVLAEQLRRDKGQNEVVRLVYSLIQEDSMSPNQEIISMVKAGLASRGLLEAVEERKLKLFKTTRYVLPESTAAQARAQPLEPVQRLLGACQQERPEVWKMLVAQTKRAISQRTESAASSDVDD